MTPQGNLVYRHCFNCADLIPVGEICPECWCCDGCGCECGCEDEPDREAETEEVA